MIHRIDVRNVHDDPRGAALSLEIARRFESLRGIQVDVGRIFLIDSQATPHQINEAAIKLLADPIVETVAPLRQSQTSLIEVHLKPGVMDPVAASAEKALRELGIDVEAVQTGRSFAFNRPMDTDTRRSIATAVLANGVIESIHLERFHPDELPSGHQHPFALRHVLLRTMTDPELKALSRQAHLFLSLDEMQSVQRYFRNESRDPTDIELETIAQTWSEHCVHKTLKSAVAVEELDERGEVVGRRKYANLIKDTIFWSTKELMGGQKGTKGQRDKGTKKNADSSSPSVPQSLSPSVPSASPFCLSVFKDNAGVIAFDEDSAVCMKVETHNHPSAIEPYGGAATGIGGCIRDIMGTGLSARPIASSDVFCVATPEQTGRTLPRGVIDPQRVLRQVVAGVRDYGNRMGIPTVNGAVYFDERYLGNPLVFCGCVGLIPRDCIEKAARPGDSIVVMGGRTGRDGIHGATFSSAELTDTHADEFSHAVQIGNAITQKQVMDVILQARDRHLFTALTDCGAGGLSSAIGEMGEKLGATVELDRVPLKYAGLRYDEIWISEAQERMVLSVPSEHVQALLRMSVDENVEATVIGTFGTTDAQLMLNYRGENVGKLAMAFLHDGLPTATRRATVRSAPLITEHDSNRESFTVERLLRVLASPNVASKHWIIRQYDHEVQGGSVIKPLVGAQQIGPSDAAVFRPKMSSFKGVAISCGLCPHISDPYRMAVAAIDEAVRNVIAVGASLDQLALLDNFCWPSVDDDLTMGTLVRACEACRDVALAFGTPFISGKDSLHNQFTNSETGQVTRIPATLLISAIGVVDDVRRCITMDFKRPGSAIVLIAARNEELLSLAETHRAVERLIASGRVLACHDVSDGGIVTAIAEMCIASGIGCQINPDCLNEVGPWSEQPGQYVLEMATDFAGEIPTLVGPMTKLATIGVTQSEPVLEVLTQPGMQVAVDSLLKAWRGTFDW